MIEFHVTFEKRDSDTPAGMAGHTHTITFTYEFSYEELEGPFRAFQRAGYTIVSVVVKNIRYDIEFSSHELVNSWSTPKFPVFLEFVEAALKNYGDTESVVAAILWGGFDQFGTDWRDNFHGCYDSPEDYAQSLYEDIHSEWMNNAPDGIAFDWESVARDMEYGNTSFQELAGNVYVFTS